MIITDYYVDYCGVSGTQRTQWRTIHSTKCMRGTQPYLEGTEKLSPRVTFRKRRSVPQIDQCGRDKQKAFYSQSLVQVYLFI